MTIAAHTSSHATLRGVTVTGSWSAGSTATSSCTTNTKGSCQVTSGSIAKTVSSVAFTATGATRTGYIYQPADNHDPDGDSSGTIITIPRP